MNRGDLHSLAHSSGGDARKPIDPTMRLVCDCCSRAATLMGCTADGWHFWLCGEHDGVSGADALRRKSEVRP